MLVTVVGVVALTASLLVDRPAPADTSVAETAPEPLGRTVLADVTGTGRLLVRGRRGTPYFEDDALVVRTTGPVTPELLDTIRLTRAEEELIYVLAYDDSGPWPRGLLYQEYRFAPDTGWVAITGG
jgi:hypothetical protein